MRSTLHGSLRHEVHNRPSICDGGHASRVFRGFDVVRREVELCKSIRHRWERQGKSEVTRAEGPWTKIITDTPPTFSKRRKLVYGFCRSCPGSRTTLMAPLAVRVFCASDENSTEREAFFAPSARENSGEVTAVSSASLLSSDFSLPSFSVSASGQSALSRRGSAPSPSVSPPPYRTTAVVHAAWIFSAFFARGDESEDRRCVHHSRLGNRTCIFCLDRLSWHRAAAEVGTEHKGRCDAV